MGRTNPISLRLRGLINWGSNVRHPLLSAYVKHVFQGHLVATPGIRASTLGLWVNVTVFSEDAEKLLNHPKLAASEGLSFSSVNIVDALGRSEKRIAEFTGDKSKNSFMQNLVANVDKVDLVKERTSVNYKGVSPLIARASSEGVLDALHIYRDVPIHLQINVIKNPVLNADILARYIANQLSLNKQLPRIYKSILSKLSA